MEVILYDPKGANPPPHETVLDALGGRNRKRELAELWSSHEGRKDKERQHRACLAGETSDPPLGTTFGGQALKRDEWNTCTHDKACRVHQLWPCAACNWTDPAVVKVRAAKKARLNAFLRTGKLPPITHTWTWPKKLDDAQFHEVHLPVFPMDSILTYWPQDLFLEDVYRKYLTAKGERITRKDAMAHVEHWSCGCQTAMARQDNTDGWLVQACDKHKRALTSDAD